MIPVQHILSLNYSVSSPISDPCKPVLIWSIPLAFLLNLVLLCLASRFHQENYLVLRRLKQNFMHPINLALAWICLFAQFFSSTSLILLYFPAEPCTKLFFCSSVPLHPYPFPLSTSLFLISTNLQIHSDKSL